MKAVLRGTIMAESPIRDTRRNFPLDIKGKETLYDRQYGYCTICDQSLDLKRIGDGRYVHIDHAIAHSRGGETIPEKKRSAGSCECNLKKGASQTPAL